MRYQSPFEPSLGKDGIIARTRPAGIRAAMYPAAGMLSSGCSDQSSTRPAALCLAFCGRLYRDLRQYFLALCIWYAVCRKS